MVRCGVVGLQLHHREAQRGVLHCFEEVVGLAMPEVPGGIANPKAQQFMPTVEQVHTYGRVNWVCARVGSASFFVVSGRCIEIVVPHIYLLFASGLSRLLL